MKKLSEYAVYKYTDGKTRIVRRLWIRGKYVPDPRIVLNEEARTRIKNNIAIIRRRIDPNA